jgi:hypothetical protein
MLPEREGQGSGLLPLPEVEESPAQQHIKKLCADKRCVCCIGDILTLLESEREARRLR